MIPAHRARLVRPSEEYLDSYLEACREFRERNVHLISLHDPDTFHSWKNTIIQRFEDNHLGRNLPPGFVPSTTYWLVEDGRFIGLGNLRHYLNPSLERIGGHIGYGIRPSRWNMGYGTWQLKLLLDEAAKMGMERVLLTCDENNLKSFRVMEKNGGIYQDTIENIEGGVTQRIRRCRIDTPAAFNCYNDTARLYDFNNREVMTEDVPFCLNLAAEKGGSILELASGTGRVTFPLARAGHNITGVELSRAMTGIFRQKYLAEEKAVQDRIELIQGNMARFSLGKAFDLVMIPFRAFQALTDPADAKSCLACVAEHMAEGAWLTINAFRPYNGMEESWCYPETVQWERDDWDAGLHIRKLTCNERIDAERKILYPRYAYEVTALDGSFERLEERLALRYYDEGELRGMLEGAGFRIVRAYGWYDGRPLDEGDEMIFICERARAK